MTDAVRKYGVNVPMTDEQYGAAIDLSEAYERWQRMTPKERARAAQDAKDRRVTERAAVAPVELTMSGLLDRLGWSEKYAAHLLQPYCSCDWDMDGWHYCQHATDLDLTP